MRYILPLILVILILSGCDSNLSRTALTSTIIIKEPKLSELTSSNPDFLKAIDKIKKHLTVLNVPIDSMYFVGVDSTTEEEWKFRVIHYNNYLVQTEYQGEKTRIDSLKKAGIFEYSYNFILPTGNWGGFDRTFLYSTSEHKITADMIDQ